MFMGEIIASQTPDIKSLILTIRDTQVLLDSDVAMLYGYETRAINQTVSRNKDRFPESFRFRLTEGEWDAVVKMRSQNVTASLSEVMQSQNVTASKRNVRYLPYVFAEPGIAMLSGLLKNEVAVQVSIGIMSAFVEMRKFISVYGSTFERLTNIEYKLLDHDRKFDKVFDLIQLQTLPQQGIFFKGQIYDAFNLIVKIIGEAKRTLVVIDNYADDTVLDMLTKRKRGVDAIIVTASPGRITQIGLSKINAQYPTVSVVKSDEFHDRFIIVDDKAIYHSGASLKDAGKRCFAISALEDTAALLANVRSIVGK
jgi:hypothetical protein